MHPDEKQITPAQRALLSHVSPHEAPGIARHLCRTLYLALGFYCARPEPDDCEAPPLFVVETWFYVVDLMDHILAVADEAPAKA